MWKNQKPVTPRKKEVEEEAEEDGEGKPTVCGVDFAENPSS